MEVLPQQFFQNVKGRGALQINFAHTGGNIADHTGYARGQCGEVAFGAGGVDYQEEFVRSHTVDDEIIQHTALFIEQETIAAFTFLERVKIMGHGAGQFFGGPFAFKHELPHMADIENRCGASGVVVFRQNALILDGHVPSGEGGHFRPVTPVPGGKRRFSHFGHGKLKAKKKKVAVETPRLNTAETRRSKQGKSIRSVAERPCRSKTAHHAQRHQPVISLIKPAAPKTVQYEPERAAAG